MSTDVEICNRALDEIGARVIISSLTENTPQGRVAARQYDPTRKQLLRAAPWGFSRKTDLLVTEGLLSNVPPDSPYPWQAKNTYPLDCLKMHYILPQPTSQQVAGVPTVGDTLFAPWCAPSRNFRYIPAYDPGSVAFPGAHRVLLTNITPVLGIYTFDVTDTTLFDALFENALVMALANRFCQPLSGNVKLKMSYAQLAQDAIIQARVADGNEAIPSSDHTPDWIQARGLGGVYPGNTFGPQMGMWYSGWDDINWGM
jgi:hypothetical protein